MIPGAEPLRRGKKITNQEGFKNGEKDKNG